ncbi:MAG TPA: phosphatase [Actinospica sp.]|jgi:hypothetical protein|nr:phosphatase [Actinospica sp.]
MNSPDPAALLAHLTASGIAGRVATPRENNLLHYRLLADRDPYYLLGLDPSRDWTDESVLELMADRVGVSPDPGFRAGVDTIDPALTVAALDRYADRLAEAVLRRESVYFASGHPNQLAELYQRFADALRGYGCPIVRAGEGWGYDASTRYGVKRLTIGYAAAFSDQNTDGSGDVAALEDAGGPVHSHAARPIRATFAALAAAGRALPDLVVADHGWCGGAGQAGVDAIGFADCNDPALFVGEYEGVVRVAVPLDDGLEPAAYAPLGDYVLGRIEAARAMAGS